MEKNGILLWCFILVINLVRAQSTVNIVVTEKDNSPLAFANIILHNIGNTQDVQGTTSDEFGRGAFRNIKRGEYFIEISMLGFKTVKSESFALLEEVTSRDFNFVLDDETSLLDEVVIKTTRPVIRQTADKLIVDLEESVMVNINLQDVMKRIPGIIVANDKISYAGQSGIRILINGKSTDYMDLSTLLRDFPADNISRVELIQQPGAEFDAEGSGPIINIILKKNVLLGTNGNVKIHSGYDNRPEYGISSSLASYRNKLNWKVNGGYRKTAWREDLYISRQVESKEYKQATISPYGPETFNFRGEVDYQLASEHSFGINSSILNSQSNRFTYNQTAIVGDGRHDELFTDNWLERQRTTFTINPYYKFENAKNKLSFDFNYVDYVNDNTNQLYQVGPSIIDFTDQQYIQNGQFQINTTMIDYKRTVDERFEWMSGAKYTVVSTANNLESFAKNANDEFVFEPMQRNRFLIDERIFALYFKLDKKFEKWTLGGGVRWEYSDTEGFSVSNSEKISRVISKLFPNVTVKRKLSEEIGLSLAYNYRIQRPSYNSLNTFVYYYDPYTFEEGNPNLKPEFTNSLLFNLTYNEQPFFSIGYKHTNDALFELITQNDQTAQISRSVVNLTERINWTSSLFAPLSFIAGLDGYTGAIVNYNKYKSSELSPVLDLDNWSVTWYTNIQYQLPWELKSELTGFYLSGGLQGQIEHRAMTGLNFALSRSFFEDKLKANLSINEILDRKFKGSVNYSNVNADVISDWSRQNVSLQLTYNFGTSFSKKTARKDLSESEQDRIKDNN